MEELGEAASFGGVPACFVEVAGEEELAGDGGVVVALRHELRLVEVHEAAASASACSSTMIWSYSAWWRRISSWFAFQR